MFPVQNTVPSRYPPLATWGLIAVNCAIFLIAQVKQAAAGLLQRTLPADRAEALAEKLATGTWSHDYPIWATTAKELGLRVRTDMPNEVLELMSLYPQPVRPQGGSGVEYLPGPRQKEA